jgi:hypothetical protein
MAVNSMGAKGKTMNENAAGGELASRIAADSQDLIGRFTMNGAFVLTLTTNIATAQA